MNPGTTDAGWHMWTGPSGERYAAPGGRPTITGVTSVYTLTGHEPACVTSWLEGGRGGSSERSSWQDSERSFRDETPFWDR